MGSDGLQIALRINSGLIAVNGDLLSSGGNLSTGFFGGSRDNSADFDYRRDNATATLVEASEAPDAGAIAVFGEGTAASSGYRLATYHAGPALNLATLEGLQDTLITEIAAI